MSMGDNLNYMNFGIMDVAGNQVKAGAGFIYNGYIISMSNVMKNPAVAVFIDCDDGADLVYDAPSVQSAIEWVNNNGK